LGIDYLIDVTLAVKNKRSLVTLTTTASSLLLSSGCLSVVRRFSPCCLRSLSPCWLVTRHHRLLRWRFIEAIGLIDRVVYVSITYAFTLSHESTTTSFNSLSPFALHVALNTGPTIGTCHGFWLRAAIVLVGVAHFLNHVPGMSHLYYLYTMLFRCYKLLALSACVSCSLKEQ
jgi:hypothetical protein